MDPLLQTYDIYQLKAIANDLKITPCGDRRKRETWVKAIRKAERIAKLTEVCCEPTDKTSSELEVETAKVDAPPKNHKLKVLTSNKSDEHYTPENIIDAAREVMGEIDLDPMSCAEANETVRAVKFYTKEDDGLTKPWTGRVWLNPAFSLADKAVQMLLQSYMTGVTTEAILLIKAAPDTKRHQSLSALPFCEMNKRIKFVAPGNVQAPFAVLIFYLGKNFPKFREVFGKFGNIRLGTIQVDELENDRRELLAKVAQLQLQLAKKSNSVESEPDRLDWLEQDIDEQIDTAQHRLRELEIDREILPDEIFVRQRLEWTTKLQTLNYTKRAIASINIRFTEEYRQIVEQIHPNFEEDLEGYTPEFAPGKLVAGDGHLLVKIERYEFVISEWIAWCEVRSKGNLKFAIGTKFYIRPTELFSDFRPPSKEPLKFERLSIYGLGSIRSARELKREFPGVKIPTYATLWCTELTAPDGSIWQAFKENDSQRCAIKWCCEVLPNGDSRSPRIPQKNDHLEAVA
jgi:DNA N-6-adenine-methyltransferase (Dam)